MEIFVGLLQTSSNVAYMPGLYEMKIPLKKPECVMFRAGMFTQRGAASQGWGLGQLTNGSGGRVRRAGAGGATAPSRDTRRWMVAASPRTAALTRPLS